ncbi:hypothetical protein PUR71_05630 [Streptomyces sp. SP17BM10]|uniref:hypothetical protein n=1 Tax=Streptomyces sp. SP17BM10 TaxID=3002530 RepID=UPI002E78E03E|nr:hypothetical protein [Streptomyces sp. SP17BM10]MEE1782403.1 hypothetical protein [Streptomyces sp. SP17BM10]
MSVPRARTAAAERGLDGDGVPAALETGGGVGDGVEAVVGRAVDAEVRQVLPAGLGEEPGRVDGQVVGDGGDDAQLRVLAHRDVRLAVGAPSLARCVELAIGVDPVAHRAKSENGGGRTVAAVVLGVGDAEQAGHVRVGLEAERRHDRLSDRGAHAAGRGVDVWRWWWRKIVTSMAWSSGVVGTDTGLLLIVDGWGGQRARAKAMRGSTPVGAGLVGTTGAWAAVGQGALLDAELVRGECPAYRRATGGDVLVELGPDGHAQVARPVHRCRRGGQALRRLAAVDGGGKGVDVEDVVELPAVGFEDLPAPLDRVDRVSGGGDDAEPGMLGEGDFSAALTGCSRSGTGEPILGVTCAASAGSGLLRPIRRRATPPGCDTVGRHVVPDREHCSGRAERRQRGQLLNAGHHADHGHEAAVSDPVHRLSRRDGDLGAGGDMSLTRLEAEVGPFIVVPRDAVSHWSGTEGEEAVADIVLTGLPSPTGSAVLDLGAPGPLPAGDGRASSHTSIRRADVKPSFSSKRREVLSSI